MVEKGDPTHCYMKLNTLIAGATIALLLVKRYGEHTVVF